MGGLQAILLRAVSLCPAESCVPTQLTDGSSFDRGCEQSEQSEQSQITIRAEHVSGGLRLHCPKAEIAAAVEAGRVELETILTGGDQDEPVVGGLATWLRENTVAPIDCPTCGGGLDVWEDVRGGLHCAKCDPPVVAQRLRAAAERIRRRRSSSYRHGERQSRSPARSHGKNSCSSGCGWQAAPDGYRGKSRRRLRT
jgi:hypothetical protein